MADHSVAVERVEVGPDATRGTCRAPSPGQDVRIELTGGPVGVRRGAVWGAARHTVAVDVDEHLAQEHLAEELQEFVYGTLTVMVAVGGLTGSSEAPDPFYAFAAILGVAVATMLAHTFSAIIGMHVGMARPVQRAEARQVFRHSWRIVTATIPALVVFVLAGLGAFGTRTALRLSNLLAVAVLMGVALIASRRSGSTTFTTVVYVSLATLMGLTIVAIEIWVHHL